MHCSICNAKEGHYGWCSKLPESLNHWHHKQLRRAKESRARILEWAEEMKRAVDEERYCKKELKDWKNGYDCAIYDLINHLEDNQ